MSSKNQKRNRSKTTVKLQGSTSQLRQIRPNAPNQNEVISIVPGINVDNFYHLSAGFVMFALTRGAPKEKALTYLMSVQTLLISYMRNTVTALPKAPRIWWQLTNALRPKTVIHKKVSYRYDWDFTNFSQRTDANYKGIILGPVDTSTNNNGLYPISNTPGAIPSINVAADAVTDMFTYYGKDHPSIECVNDFNQDISAFAWKAPVNVGVDINNDPFASGYASVSLEVPITSWFGYLGIGLSITTTDGLGSPRIPRYTNYVQGAAGHHLGARLHFPIMIKREFVKASIDFRAIDLGVWYLRDTEARNSAAEKNVIAGRGQTQSPGAGFLPDLYQGTSVAYPGVTPNLAMLFRLYNYSAAMLGYATLWFSAAQGVCAIATGTNNVDPYAIAGLEEAAWSVTAQRQFAPAFDKRTRKLVVCFPSVSDTFVAEWNSLWPNAYYHGSSPPQSLYGGNNLDFCNSTISGNYVSIVDGPDLEDNKKAVQQIDATYSSLIPTAPAEPVGGPPGTKAGVEVEIIVPVQNKNHLLKAFKRICKDDPEGHYKEYVEYVTMKRRAQEKEIQLLMSQKDISREAAIRLNGDRTSPSLGDCGMIGSTSSLDFDASRGISDLIPGPIYLANNAQNAIWQQRIVHDCSKAFLPGNAEGTKGFYIQEIGAAADLVQDPVNPQKTEFQEVIYSMAVDSVVTTKPDWSQMYDNLAGLLPPNLGMVAKGIKPLVGKISEKIQKRRMAKGKKQLVKTM